MINEIKACFRLMKHGYQLKINLVCGVLFSAIGIPFIMMGYERLAFCTMYFLMGNLFLSQSMNMMLYSGLMCASPSRKKIEFLYLDILNVMGGIFAIVLTLIAAFVVKSEPSESVTVEAMLVFSGLMALVLYCYMSMAFKSMFVGLVIFIVSFLAVNSMPYSKVGEVLCQVLQGKTVLAVLIFIVEVVLGIACGHGVRKLMYRKSMSKWAAGAKLREEQ